MGSRMLRRHSRVAIFLHWFNALCWFFLLATGLGLIGNESLQPLGMWWSRLMRAIFGSPETLLRIHEACGILWAGVWLVFGAVFMRSETIPFFREMLGFSPRRDMVWLIKKGIQMTGGSKVMEKAGLDPAIPAQGFYNTGQKLFAVPAVLGGAVITVTGVIMMFSRSFEETGLVQWSILLHFLTVGVVFAGLLVHIFMASVASGELPALISMFTGTVPEDYARHHHKLWYDEVARKAK